MMSLEKQMRIAMRETLRSALEALGAQVRRYQVKATALQL
jgi:hypothetical protein